MTAMVQPGQERPRVALKTPTARVTDTIKKKSRLTKDEWREYTKTGVAYRKHDSP